MRMSARERVQALGKEPAREQAVLERKQAVLEQEQAAQALASVRRYPVVQRGGFPTSCLRIE